MTPPPDRRVNDVQQLIKCILDTWKANNHAAVTGPPPVAAGALYGINGPYWDFAPEKTAFPYCVITQLPASKITWGFGGGIYTAPSVVKFKVYTQDASLGGLIDVAGYADAICSVYDKRSNYSSMSS